MNSKSTPIVCDTNIWYYLSDGTIDPQEVAGKQLIGTYISAHEFCCTHIAYRNYDVFRNAVMAYKKYPAKTYEEDPSEYIKMISNHKSIIPKWAEMTKALNRVVETEDYVASDQVRQKYLEYGAQINDVFDPFEKLIEDHRNQIKHRKIHRQKLNQPVFRSAHKEITKQLLTNLSGGASIDWDRLELFLATFDEWLRQLSLISTLKMTPHDWNDVLNLVYVQPGSLYWTFDKVKTRIFIKNLGLSHYLYK